MSSEQSDKPVNPASTEAQELRETGATPMPTGTPPETNRKEEGQQPATPSAGSEVRSQQPQPQPSSAAAAATDSPPHEVGTGEEAAGYLGWAAQALHSKAVSWSIVAKEMARRYGAAFVIDAEHFWQAAKVRSAEMASKLRGWVAGAARKGLERAGDTLHRRGEWLQTAGPKVETAVAGTDVVEGSGQPEQEQQQSASSHQHQQ